MKDIINEEICFSNSDGLSDCTESITLNAGKKSKLFVRAYWTDDRYEPSPDFSRGITIQDLFKFLCNRDKYINECSKELCSKEIAELRQMVEIKTKELREAGFKIFQLEEKTNAFKTTLRELRKK